MRPVVLLGLVAAMARPESTSDAQESPVTWSGSLRSRAGIERLVYSIPATPGLHRFAISRPGVVAVEATDIQLEGITVRFTAELGQRANCKVDAVPARGYEGSCVLASGDSLAMTLVPPIAGMLLPDHEVLLARDAGPPDIARNASVFVLGPSGYSEVVRGTNGFTCFIERPTADDIWPMCQNREAAEALMPVERARMRLHISKVNEAAITDSVLAGYRRKQFRAPPSAAMAYMLSRYAWTTTNRETGARGFISPHLHFYAPYATNQRVGVDTTQRPVVPLRVEREGRPDASIIVGVRLIPPAPPREAKLMTDYRRPNTHDP